MCSGKSGWFCGCSEQFGQLSKKPTIYIVSFMPCILPVGDILRHNTSFMDLVKIIYVGRKQVWDYRVLQQGHTLAIKTSSLTGLITNFNNPLCAANRSKTEWRNLVFFSYAVSVRILERIVTFDAIYGAMSFRNVRRHRRAPAHLAPLMGIK